MAAGVIVGLMGENEVNKDPTLTNTAQADPIEDFQDNSGDPDFTVSIKSMLLTLLFTQHLVYNGTCIGSNLCQLTGVSCFPVPFKSHVLRCG